MKTVTLPNDINKQSPAGADVRFLIDASFGGMIHSTVPPHQVNKATRHATVSELWYVLEGEGEIWRDNGSGNHVTTLIEGTSIDIPAGTAFQYRNTSNADLTFICITVPPWPGATEATFVDGRWAPTI